MNPVLSLIIVGFNNSDIEIYRLVSAAAAAAKESGLGFESILVSNDGRRPDAELDHFIDSGANLGFAGGCAEGQSRATGDWILYSNADLEIDPIELATFLTRNTRDSRADVVVPLLVDSRFRPDASAYHNATLNSVRLLSLVPIGRVLRGTRRRELPTFMKAPGAFVLFSSQAALLLGPFDREFFLYAEDRDMSRRARDLGYTLTLDPALRVRHFSGGSGAGMSSFVDVASFDGSLRVASRTRRPTLLTRVAILESLAISTARFVLLRGDRSQLETRVAVARRWWPRGAHPARLDADSTKELAR